MTARPRVHPCIHLIQQINRSPASCREPRIIGWSRATYLKHTDFGGGTPLRRSPSSWSKSREVWKLIGRDSGRVPEYLTNMPKLLRRCYSDSVGSSSRQQNEPNMPSHVDGWSSPLSLHADRRPRCSRLPAGELVLCGSDRPRREG